MDADASKSISHWRVSAHTGSYKYLDFHVSSRPSRVPPALGAVYELLDLWR
jgi:hypothetical protein